MALIDNMLKTAEKKEHGSSNEEHIIAAETDSNGVEHIYMESTRTTPKRSSVLFVGAIVGTVCAIYLVSYMGNSASSVSGSSSASALGVSLGIAIATPSVVLSCLATIFAWIGYGTRTPGFALTAGILYAVSIAIMTPWAMFNIVQMILCFVGYSSQKKLNGGKTS